MSEVLTSLLSEIKSSRVRVIDEVAGLSIDEGRRKFQEEWNIQEVIEHLVLAERGGFDLIYTAAESYREGNPVWAGESENDGLTIEQIIERTWQPKEKAPPSATPQGKWSLEVWLAHFQNCDDLLRHLMPILKGLPLQDVVYPHFLCGPLNAQQRLEFIRFHIDRHHSQIINMKKALK